MSLLGKIAYHGFHQPRTFCTEFFSEGGFVHERINQWHGGQLLTAVGRLPALPAAPGLTHDVHYLTGRSFWHLSAVAAYSLLTQTGGTIRPVFHSDGRLDLPTIDRLQALFPAARFVTNADQARLLEHYAPVGRFPVLHRLWKEFILIRKLLSVHLGRAGWNLFIDSDTLFWRRPDFLLTWYDRPAHAICMEDMADAYGYDPATMARLCGRPVPPKINTGLIALHSPSLDLDRLEFFARELLASKGLDYFLEQAMTAMLLAGTDFAYAPPPDYFIPLSIERCRPTAGVFHHYAGPARKWLYRHAWRQLPFLAQSPQP